MELEAGGGSARRRRLSEEGRDGWAGLTLGAVLGNDKRTGAPVQVSRTLLDIIRDEEPNSGAYENLINHHNNKKNWKSFKDRLRLRRASAAWTSSVHSPTSDAAPGGGMQTSRSMLTRRNSTRMPATVVPNSGESAEDASELVVVCDVSTRACRPQITRRLSTRSPSSTADSTQSSSAAIESDEPPAFETVPVSDVPVQNLRSHMLRRNSSHLPAITNQSTQADPFNECEPVAPSVRLSAALAAEREQIQRVVSSSSEAAAEAEAENVVEETAEEEAAAGQQPVRMSLMDLLEETDRQMGWVSYSAVQEDDEDEEEEDGGDDQGGAAAAAAGGTSEYTCCVCMVRHKGAAFIPCGHTFCRLCSRELWVSRGNCPLCNGFILEILDIF